MNTTMSIDHAGAGLGRGYRGALPLALQCDYVRAPSIPKGRSTCLSIHMFASRA